MRVSSKRFNIYKVNHIDKTCSLFKQELTLEEIETFKNENSVFYDRGCTYNIFVSGKKYKPYYDPDWLELSLPSGYEHSYE